MFQRLNHRAGHYALLGVVWALVCLPNLGGPSLWDIDEGNNTGCSLEMFCSGNWVLPTFNYQMRTDKPALLYWLQALAYQAFGVNEFAARLPSALAALLTILVTYELGRQTFGKRAGLLAGLILASAGLFCAAGHFANPDALLTAFTTLTLFLFWHDYRRDGTGWLSAAGASAGVAVLAKGPVGLVLPAAVTFLFFLWRGQLRRLLDRRLPLAALCFLVVAAPWYAWVAVETKWVWVAEFWQRHHAERVATPLENHGGPVYYYALVLIAGLAPWSVFLGPALWHAWRRSRPAGAPLALLVGWVVGYFSLFAWVRCLLPGCLLPLCPAAFFLGPALWAAWRRPGPARAPAQETEDGGRAAVQLLVCWVAVYLVFFSQVQTKLPNYVLPLYPAAALLLAFFLDRWRRGLVTVAPWVMPVSLACLALLGVGVAVGLGVAGGALDLPGVPARHGLVRLPGLEAWAGLGAVLLAGAGVAGWCLRRGSPGGLVGAVAASAVLFAAVLGARAVEAVERYKAPRPLVRALPADQTRREVRVGAYGYFQPSLVFYCQREVARFEEERDAIQFLRGPLPAYLFLPADVWVGLRGRVAGARLVARHYDLYDGRDVVVVTNEPDEGMSSAPGVREGQPTSGEVDQPVAGLPGGGGALGRTGGGAEGGADLVGAPPGAARPDQGGEGGGLRGGGGRAGERLLLAPGAGERHRRHQVRLDGVGGAAAGAVRQPPPAPVHRTHGDHLGAVAREGDAPLPGDVLQPPAQGHQVEAADLGGGDGLRRGAHAHGVGVFGARVEADHDPARRPRPRRGGAADLLPGRGVAHHHLQRGLRRAAHLHRHPLLAEGVQQVVAALVGPLVPAVTPRPQGATPVAQGGVAGAGEEQGVTGPAARAQFAGQGLVQQPATLGVAPGRHDDGAGNDLGPLRPRPAHRLQELLGPLRLPVGEE
jgi:4-amino-4-deoxy-L-arabinose transferase-like glycosyltransferase